MINLRVIKRTDGLRCTTLRVVVPRDFTNAGEYDVFLQHIDPNRVFGWEVRVYDRRDPEATVVKQLHIAEVSGASHGWTEAMRYLTETMPLEEQVPRVPREEIDAHLDDPEGLLYELPTRVMAKAVVSKLSEQYARENGFTSQAEMRDEDWS